MSDSVNMRTGSSDIRIAFEKTTRTVKTSLLIIVGVLLTVNLIDPLVERYYERIFTGNYLVDPLVGAILGSVSFGIPIVSYVTGGQFLKEGVSLLVVTAFVLSWSMVYTVMMPLEISCLGRTFSILRNALNFVSVILISMLTVFTLSLFA